MSHKILLSIVLGLLQCAGVALGSGGGGHGHAPAVEATDSSDPIRGIKLGDFLLRDHSPIEGVKTRIGFTLYAAVRKEHAAEFERILHHQQARINDHILTAVRLVPLQAFDEPDLKTFRRRILLRLRRAMPELKIDELFLTDFNFISK
jgi:hypothetical protein